MAVPPSFSALDSPIASGTTIIEASAGTGKTHAITRLVLRLLLEGHVSEVNKLVVVTYTNAATAELSERVRTAIAHAAKACAGEAVTEADLRILGARHGAAGAVILREALLRCDELPITTIHGFCKRVLETAAFESGMPFAAEFTTDDTALVTQAAMDVWRSRLYHDAELAALAATRDWSIAALTSAYAIWRRHEAAVILPPAASLTTARAAVMTAIAAVSAAWDVATLTKLLAGLAFKKNVPLQAATIERSIAAVDQLRHGLTFEGLTTALHFARDSLHAAFNLTKVRKLPEHPAFMACTGLMHALDDLDHAWRIDVLHDMQRRFTTAKHDARILAFDDLLQRLRDALRDPHRGPALKAIVRERYQAALIDEFQDTDPAQCEIFTTLFGNQSRLVLVGDPKQAIYAFRGADLDTYLDASATADQHYQLDTNWRSSTPLVAAVNAVFSSAQRPFLAERIAFHPVRAAGTADAKTLIGEEGASFRWWLAGDGTTQSKEVVGQDLLAQLSAEATRLIAGTITSAGQALAPRDIAVLVRTNYQALDVHKALAAVGVPAIIGGCGNVLDSIEAEELARVLAAIADPGHATRLRGALVSTLWGWSAENLIALNNDDRQWQSLIDSIEPWRQRWQREGPGALIEHLLDGEGWSARLLATPGGERRLTNLRHLRELLQTAADEQHLSPAGLLAWLTDARIHGRLEREQLELRLESDADAVRVLTMHSAKGLEFPVVFCPFLWEAADQRDQPCATRLDGQRVIAWPGATAALAKAEADALAESLRLTYVALTRAKQRCYVAWATTKGSSQSALAYLLAQPPGPAAGDDTTWATSVRTFGAAADMRAAIQALIARNPDTMAMIGGAAATTPRAQVIAASGSARRVQFAAGQLTGWRTTSFTGLSAGTETTIHDHADPSAAVSAVPTGIHAFAAGARAGSCLHYWLEHLDWQQPLKIEPLTQALTHFGLSDDAVAPALLSAGEALRSTAIPLIGTSLAAIPPNKRQVEWSFHLPLANLRPCDLAELFATHGNARSRSYAPHLTHLSHHAVRGFLTGFVDLIIEHDQRWWIIDWKSNRLGSDDSAYHDEALWQAMFDHHYLLQQQLYLLALHRHLRSRLSDYDPRRHLGGAVYVFLRGLSGGQPWWHQAADIPLIEALDHALIGPAVTT